MFAAYHLTLIVPWGESLLLTTRSSHNGLGLPADFNSEANSSMGMQVVRSLAHQIRADLTVSNDNGTAFQLTWNLRKPAEAQPAAA